jgi:hypothetical protein
MMLNTSKSAFFLPIAKPSRGQNLDDFVEGVDRPADMKMNHLMNYNKNTLNNFYNT